MRPDTPDVVSDHANVKTDPLAIIEALPQHPSHAVGQTAAPSCQCPLLAQSGYPDTLNQCLLLGVKRTSCRDTPMSANDPKRTWPSLT